MRQNEYWIDGADAYIRLTQGQVAVIDAEDLALVLPYRWNAHFSKKTGTFYARTTLPGTTKQQTMHRLLLDPPDELWVDHKDFDTLNNRRSNLRLVTPSENRLHQRARVNTSTGLSGIHVHVKEDGRKYYFVTVKRQGVARRKSFPFTPHFLEEAKELVRRWSEDIHFEPDTQPKTYAPRRIPPKVRSATGVRGVGIHNGMYTFRCFSQHCPIRLIFPLTPAGFEAATKASNEHHQESTPSPARVSAEGAYIALAHGLKTLIDADDIPRVTTHSWQPVQSGDLWYARSPRVGYLHRFIVSAPEGMQVDHLNHDTLDNRKQNLRVVTAQKNNANRNGAFATSKMGVRGVSIQKVAGVPRYFVFRCHCRECKVSKLFPYTGDGFEQAKVFGEAHRAEMKRRGLI